MTSPPTEEIAIEVRELRKTFSLTHHRPASIKAAVFTWWKTRREPLEALKGVTFTVPRGQAVGIIGRNGSAKSTLLALLSNIYRPTSGVLRTHGRVATLLELGGGFHPDLTGLENAELMAVIYGVKRSEMTDRLATIAEFSELEDYIDAPVRTYSSGMTMRLGFAIAIAVDPAILLIDEVFAVGDESFQHKCHRKLREFRQQGRTIVFVSHDMAAVRRLTERTLWMDQGRLRMDGPTDDVVSAYLHAIAAEEGQSNGGL